ncbi:hypothetical protein CWO17_15610 [Vibrio sp. 10N.286.45.A3]|uniref:hypothetical protein n=1 Tax=unclassified Vibrio TaxID=2614977 RepID=UPI000D3A189E|nr:MULTISPECIES: hypothetical protein [unclassified Vibrio]PTP01521.1 hypothetical protein CWO17_15610 [Vibrio sp. 10N.286.45.A3]TKE82379.1 hypothetical protein FCV56_12600 [Vibrio sp. F12]TKE98169.1 hypothetical protein FCV61_11820 [Vibrio sp. F12]
MEERIYYPIDKQTQEILAPVRAEYRGGVYHIPRDALQSEPLQPKQGFAVVAVLDESGDAIDSEYIEDHRGVTIYDESDCTKSEVVSELGPVNDGVTLDKPSTPWDEWINNAWITNKSNQHIAEYNQVDNVRRGLYTQVCDPLFAEANIKRLQGCEDDARAIEAQALAARDNIQTENPWPTPPTN